jgi:hypothetical protein
MPQYFTGISGSVPHRVWTGPGSRQTALAFTDQDIERAKVDIGEVEGCFRVSLNVADTPALPMRFEPKAAFQKFCS